MISRICIVGPAMVVGLILTVVWLSHVPAVGQEKRAQPLQRWEYKWVGVTGPDLSRSEPALNSIGSEGWELIATVVPFRREEPYQVSLIFKRPKR